VNVGAVHASKPGEDVCGDAWAWRLREQRIVLMLADGLGHGLHAHDAAAAATATFALIHEHPPARVVEDTHAALRATRGAAVAVLAADLDHRTIRYCGLGNISTTILHSARQTLVSMNGTAGHTASRLQEFQYPLPANAVIVMHSDGLTSHWDLGPYPGLRTRDASVIAGVLYRDFSRRRDDVTVVVAKAGGED
jgi:serine phosphatase RsbU (regulator of sigma subunit)